MGALQIGEAMSIKRAIKNCLSEYQERHLIRSRREHEIRKFEDPRRVKIYESVDLTAEQKQQIDELYLTNYGERISYTWHRHYTAFTGNFDPAYFPELLYIPEFEHFMNGDAAYRKAMEDKNMLPLLAAGTGVRMPRTIFSSAAGVLRDGANRVSNLDTIKRSLPREKLFAKPSVDSGSGKGCILVDPYSESFDEEIKQLGRNFVVQERIACSDSVSALHPESVNTFRVMTYLWNGKVEVVPQVMRIGCGESYLDNAHAGGIFIAVNEDGTLHDRAFSEFRDVYTEHPDTHIRFQGYQIKNYYKIPEQAIRMHSAIPQLGIVNWDFTMGKDEEPVLIEANVFAGGIWIFQMAWGKGPFGDNTPEILRWIRKQKDLLGNRR